MKEGTASIAGFAVAAVPPAAGMLLFAGIGRADSSTLMDWALLTGVVYFYSVFGVVVCGGPLFLLLRSLSLVRWWSAAITGFGIAAAVVYFVGSGLDSSAQGAAKDIALFGFTGASSGFLFWLVWRAGTFSDIAS